MNTDRTERRCKMLNYQRSHFNFVGITLKIVILTCKITAWHI